MTGEPHPGPPEGTDPIPGRLVATRGLGQYVREVGSGVPVLFIHGFPCTSHMWRHQMRALADDGYRCLAADTRGYGLSGKPGVQVSLDLLARDVVDLLDAFHLPRAILVGHDWGGIIAAATTLRHPERVERLAVLDAPVSIWPYYGVHGYWFKARPRPEAFFERYAAEFAGSVIGGRERTYCGPPETAWKPLGQAGALSLAGRAARPSYLTEQDIEHYVRSFAQTDSWRHAISYYRDAIPFHFARPGISEDVGACYEHLDVRVVAEMWEHPGGLAAHPAAGVNPVYDPAYRHRVIDLPALLIYSRALVPAAFASLAPGRLPLDGPPPDVNVLVAHREQFPKMDARAVAGGHFMPEEEAARSTQLLLEFISS
jgi:pimeloyl-ACP methyl ester carboxylesterase